MIELKVSDYARLVETLRSTRFGINSISMWEVAKTFGLSYNGDGNWENGGTLYDPSTWFELGYADAITVQVTNGCVFIDIGEINSLSDDEMEVSYESCGWRREQDASVISQCGDVLCASADTATLAELQIHAVLHSIGMEVTTARVCKLVKEDSGDYFMDQHRNVPMDNLTGYVFRKYAIGNVIHLC